MMFRGAKHCSHCGAAAFDSRPVADGGPHRCPRCNHELVVGAIGDAFLEECGGCGGVWVDAQSFQQICRSREQQAAYIGSPTAAASLGTAQLHEVVKYIACPECGTLMNRMNFARHSGVIVDVCKQHGTWFDRDELREIVEFIRAGGLDAARDKELAKIEIEKQRLKHRELHGSAGALLPVEDESHPVRDIISATSDLLRFLRG
jgi:Zn-finger nucleic acid-binding protein